MSNNQYVFFMQYVKTLDEQTLLKIGKATCSTDFAVRFYNNKRHPKFFKEREKLEKALKRMWSVGAFNHRERTAQILDIDRGRLR